MSTYPDGTGIADVDRAYEDAILNEHGEEWPQWTDCECCEGWGKVARGSIDWIWADNWDGPSVVRCRACDGAGGWWDYEEEA